MAKALLLFLAASVLFAQDRPVILLVGPPGAGKTTQAKRLSSLLRVPDISMSEILRKEGGGKTALNKRLREQIATGELVNDETANALVRKRITRKDAERGFILDGYPATAAQAEHFEATLKDLGLPAPVVIHLQAPDNVVRHPMSARRRADDKPENIDRRLGQYRAEENFIVQRYNTAVKRVDGTGSQDEVWVRVRGAVAK